MFERKREREREVSRGQADCPVSGLDKGRGRDFRARAGTSMDFAVRQETVSDARYKMRCPQTEAQRRKTASKEGDYRATAASLQSHHIDNLALPAKGVQQSTSISDNESIISDIQSIQTGHLDKASLTGKQKSSRASFIQQRPNDEFPTTETAQAVARHFWP
jgi:hypothetical protein